MDTLLKVLGIVALVLFISTCGLVVVGIGNAANEGERLQKEVDDAMDEFKESTQQFRDAQGIPNEPPIITYSEFNQIQNGMTYQEVVSIIGAEGTLTSEHSNATINIDSKLYSWKNPDFSSASIGFDHGRVDSKMQYQLPK